MKGVATLRAVPSVDKLKRDPALETFSDRIRTMAAQAAVNAVREALQAGNTMDAVDFACHEAARLSKASLSRAINLSGVILHTGMGRARLAPSVAHRIAEIAASHSLLELDPDSGARGDRQTHVRSLLQELTGAEDALVVNNCAAAVLLTLRALCTGTEVLLSRGQMVEIGGSFRMPDVVRESGCTLIELGCTNRTRLSDYESRIGENTSAILRCHPSNFEIVGFHEEPSLKELANLAHRNRIILIDDVGSGCLLDTTRFGLPKEPTLADAVKLGADVVLTSGDKLLGGPQSGIILGKSDVIEKIRRHPLARTVRADKLAIAGLRGTFELYAEGRELEVPVWKYASRRASELEAIARRIASAIEGAMVAEGSSEMGGGSMPGASIPTYRVGIPSNDAAKTLEQLRKHDPPVIGRIESQIVWLDPRTLEESEVPDVMEALRSLKP